MSGSRPRELAVPRFSPGPPGLATSGPRLATCKPRGPQRAERGSAPLGGDGNANALRILQTASSNLDRERDSPDLTGSRGGSALDLPGTTFSPPTTTRREWPTYCSMRLHDYPSCIRSSAKCGVPSSNALGRAVRTRRRAADRGCVVPAADRERRRTARSGGGELREHAHPSRGNPRLGDGRAVVADHVGGARRCRIPRSTRACAR
jgi:hypothetical protein